MIEILLGSLLGVFGFTQAVDTKPQPEGAVNISQPLTNSSATVNRERVQLEPMSELKFRNVVRQAYDYSCGFGSVDHHVGLLPGA